MGEGREGGRVKKGKTWHAFRLSEVGLAISPTRENPSRGADNYWGNAFRGGRSSKGSPEGKVVAEEWKNRTEGLG